MVATLSNQVFPNPAADRLRPLALVTCPRLGMKLENPAPRRPALHFRACWLPALKISAPKSTQSCILCCFFPSLENIVAQVLWITQLQHWFCSLFIPLRYRIYRQAPRPEGKSIRLGYRDLDGRVLMNLYILSTVVFPQLYRPLLSYAQRDSKLTRSHSLCQRW